MARNRTISPDFWTWEAVIDCTLMTRLLFIGLWTFADDFGVQRLRPRTIRMQVFPGDEISNEQVRAMIDELALRGLVRIYEVEGLEYVEVVDWSQLQRVGKRARRRYPPVAPPVPGVSEPVERPLPTMANHSNGDPSPFGEAGEQPSCTIANHSIVETLAARASQGEVDADCPASVALPVGFANRAKGSGDINGAAGTA